MSFPRPRFTSTHEFSQDPFPAAPQAPLEQPPLMILTLVIWTETGDPLTRVNEQEPVATPFASGVTVSRIEPV